MPPGYREFEFDLPQALLAHLIQAFDTMGPGPLTPEVVELIPEAQGVYQLFHRGTLVYIGKTDAQSGLRQRLSRHAWTVQHRKNLDPLEVSFKAIRVYVFTAIDLETQLIQHYKATASVAWNLAGLARTILDANVIPPTRGLRASTRSFQWIWTGKLRS